MNKPSKELLSKYNVYYKQDTSFSAFARLLQSQWRQKKGFPNAPGKLGNYLSYDDAIKTRNNFLTGKIKTLVQYEVYRANVEGKLISEPRIWDNLLSSQPLCFNLFGEFHFDMNLATQYFKKLFPDRVYYVSNILFEHSPGRGSDEYTGDHSAFDVFVEYQSGTGKNGFIGIEVKYAENLKEDKTKANKVFQKHEKEYLKVARGTNIFPESSFAHLSQVPLQQIWRDHLLSITTLQDYDEVFFVFLFPSKNEECQNAITKYTGLLKTNDCKHNGFYTMYLEKFIKTLQEICKSEWTNELEIRYLGTESIYTNAK